jgi:hypothetical protein
MAYGIVLKNEAGVNTSVIRQNPFVVLTDGASVTWDTATDRFPSAKLTSTQSFTLNQTNVVSGSTGTLKIITNTASAITITFDSDFTNKRLGTTGDEVFTTYTLPASTAKEYILQYVTDGTTLHWTIGDSTVGAYSGAFAPVFTGFASQPTNVIFRYTTIGKFCHWTIFMTDTTTSNSVNFTFTLPFNAKASGGVQYAIPTMMFNSGSLVVGPGRITIPSGSNIATVFHTANGVAAWGTTGDKRILGNGMYEID